MINAVRMAIVIQVARIFTGKSRDRAKLPIDFNQGDMAINPLVQAVRIYLGILVSILLRCNGERR
jgi:hypothetical protein